MQAFTGERTLMRIHIGERDRFEGQPLYEAIVRLLHDRGFAGATVLRGIMGYGANSKVHSVHFGDLVLDLPIVVEAVESEEKIGGILPDLDRMLGGGLITLERAKVIMYRADVPPERRTGSWAIDTGKPA